MDIIYLRDYPQLYPQISRWIFEEFPYSFEGVAFEEWLEFVREGNQDGSMTSFVLLEDNSPVATASFDQTDFPPRDHLTPWLASVFTLPEHRGKGLAGKLLARVDEEAKAQGFEQIYLHTTDQMTYYAKRGWVELEQLEFWGRTNVIMFKILS